MQISWPSVANLAKDLVTPLPFLLIPLPHRDVEKTEYYKSHYSHAVSKEKWMFLEGAINLVPFQLHDSESSHAQLSQHSPEADVWKGMKGVVWKFLDLCLLLKTVWFLITGSSTVMVGKVPLAVHVRNQRRKRSTRQTKDVERMRERVGKSFAHDSAGIFSHELWEIS